MEKESRKGRKPIVKSLKMTLTPNLSYWLEDGYVIICHKKDGYKAKFIGKDQRYDIYPDKEVFLLYRNGKMYLTIAKKISRPQKYMPKDVVGLDINEKN